MAHTIHESTSMFLNPEFNFMSSFSFLSLHLPNAHKSFLVFINVDIALAIADSLNELMNAALEKTLKILSFWL